MCRKYIKIMIVKILSYNNFTLLVLSNMLNTQSQEYVVNIKYIYTHERVILKNIRVKRYQIFISHIYTVLINTAVFGVYFEIWKRDQNIFLTQSFFHITIC